MHLSFKIVFATALFLTQCSIAHGQDSSYVRILIDSAMAKGYTMNESMPLFEEAEKLAKQQDYVELQAFALKGMGIVHYYRGEYPQSIGYWKYSTELYEKLNKRDKVASNVNNLGNAYMRLGRFAESLEAYRKCVKTADATGNRRVMAAALGNMGNVYEKTGDYTKALEMHKQSFSIDSADNNFTGMGNTLTNIGTVFEHLSRGDLAYEAYMKALTICTKNDDSLGIAAAYSNIGNIFQVNGEYETARKYHLQSLAISRRKSNHYGIALSLNNLAGLAQKSGDVEQAMQLFNEALQVSQNHKFNDILLYCYKNLSDLHFDKQQWQLSATYMRKYVDLEKELFGQEKILGLARQEMLYEYDMKVLKDSITQVELDKKREFEDKKKELEIEREREQKRIAQFVMLAVLLAAMVMAWLVIQLRRSGKRRKEQMIFIEAQRRILEDKNQSISESMDYGRLIQQQFLPEDDVLSGLPLNYAAWLSPRDVLGGDFYFIKQINNTVWVAVADCTGHGVPGAMLAVMANQILSRSVNEIILPSQVLEKAHKSFVKALGNKSKHDIQDGMDASLLKIDLVTREMWFSGARNNAFLMRNQDITVLQATRRSVGLTIGEEPLPFQDTSYQLLKGDRLFMFTDGIFDQPVMTDKGEKKMGISGLRKILLEFEQIHEMHAAIQHIRQAHEKLSANIQQIDDLCILGLHCEG